MFHFLGKTCDYVSCFKWRLQYINASLMCAADLLIIYHCHPYRYRVSIEFAVSAVFFRGVLMYYMLVGISHFRRTLMLLIIDVRQIYIVRE